MSPREKWIKLRKEYEETDFHECTKETVLNCAQKLIEYRDACVEVDEPTHEMLEYDMALVLEKIVNIFK